MDELVTVRESVHLSPFQTEIIEGQVKPLLGDMAHVMIMPLKVGEGQLWEARPLPPGLHVLYAYTHLKNGSGRVSLVVRNMSDSHIFLKKGLPVAHIRSMSLVPPTELSPEMEAALGMEAKPEPMSVMARQEKLLEKLNLDGLAHWSSRNAAVARELVLAYHDVFGLESNELGCTSAMLSMRYALITASPLRSGSDAYLSPYWRKCTHHSRTCWMQERFIQANHHGATW